MIDTDLWSQTIRDALEASYHIAECGDHREHLLDAERKARLAIAALARLDAEVYRLRGDLESVMEWKRSLADHLSHEARTR